MRGFESEIYRKDGSTMWISENARAVRDESGEISYFEGMVEDITERQRLETELHRSEQSLSALINNIDDSIWSVDSEVPAAHLQRRLCAKLRGAVSARRSRWATSSSTSSRAEWRGEDVALYDRALAGEKFIIERRYQYEEEERYYEISYNPIRTNDAVSRRRRLQQGHHRAPARAHRAAGGDGRRPKRPTGSRASSSPT